MKIIFAFLLSFSSIAQIGTGQWRLHVSNTPSVDVALAENIVYTAFESGMMEYDISTGDKSSWNKVNGLSDIGITSLLYCTSQKGLFIGYENGNLDFLKNNQITNLPAIRLADILGNKRINKITEYNGLIYIATGFSIVVIDPLKLEVKDTYYPTNGLEAIQAISFLNDTIYTLTPTELKKGGISNVALADFSQWTIESKVPALSQNGIAYKGLEVVNEKLFVLKCNENNYAGDSVFCLANNGLIFASNNGFDLEIYSMTSNNGQLCLNIDSGILFFQELTENNFVQSSHIFVQDAAIVNSVVISPQKAWMADKYKGGLVKYENGNSEHIKIEGPPKNDFYKVTSYKGKTIIAGGTLDYKYMTYNQSGVYSFEDETWSLMDKASMTLWQGKDIWDFVSTAINPKKTSQIAVGTYSPTPLSIIENGIVTETYDASNSNIEVSQQNQSTLIAGLSYDKNGNLWLINSFSESPLKVLKNDKTWGTMNLPSTVSDVLISHLIIDNQNNKWIIAPSVGIVAFKDNETIDDLSDDAYKLINNGDNTGALPSNDVTAIAMDLDNELWIGTETGFAILYNAPNVFDAANGSYNVQRIKLEFEDNVEYLLGETHITDIVVDGGNRKWMGTANTGIFLLSADGTEILQHLTSENSSLISDVILDLEINQSNGEMYIVTDKGLISYRIDASEGKSNYDEVEVFPNPVLPNYNGVITMQGIKYDSDVKITDVAGNLIYKTTSNGGTATWNGKTVNGQKASTGVYLIWTSPNEGKGRKVGKVVLIN